MPIALANDHLRTVIDPDQGTSLHSFQVCREGAWLSLMPDVEDPSCDLAAASFLMVPYSNRIADGAFTFAGQRYELQNAANHAMLLHDWLEPPRPTPCGQRPGEVVAEPLPHARAAASL